MNDEPSSTSAVFASFGELREAGVAPENLMLGVLAGVIAMVAGPGVVGAGAFVEGVGRFDVAIGQDIMAAMFSPIDILLYALAARAGWKYPVTATE